MESATSLALTLSI